jgi:hypothetical protein
MRSTAAPESTGCVQQAMTSRAPLARSAFAAAANVPAVSTMSSTMSSIARQKE